MSLTPLTGSTPRLNELTMCLLLFSQHLRLRAAVMGNSKSGAVSKEILEELKLNTKFSETEIVQWYENFKKQCPSGRITKEEFQNIYRKFFPDSDANTYAHHVFRSFDANDDGTLDFKEYIIALHMTATGKTTSKLEWAFSLFDVDKNGYITKSEVTEICTVSFGYMDRENCIIHIEFHIRIANMILGCETVNIIIILFKNHFRNNGTRNSGVDQ
ncbi:hypothetical protein GOODEAATRI_014419 [Goodea atripinnis]|uniref:EF-hand domain-containing protein n=1 Tax=Goodea atripinnis TaxID=208336 RepID=A0ABV0PE67_9TELE